MNPLIVSAFPATGKTHLAERCPELVDSDSSSFSWKWVSFDVRERHPDWPTNYLQHIDAALQSGATALVSTHEEIRTALALGGIPFVLVYPRADLRDEYIRRLEARESPRGLIDKVASEWLPMMVSLQAQQGCAHVVLGPGQYLGHLAFWEARVSPVPYPGGER